MTRGRERGFVLLAVLLVLTLLAVVVTELAFSARLEASMVRSYRDGVLARHLAEAAVQQAIREIATPAQVAALDDTGQLVFYRVLPGQTTPTRLPALPRVRVALGAGEFSYRLADESARLGLNTPAPNRFARLLDALGVDASERDIIVDSLQVDGLGEQLARKRRVLGALAFAEEGRVPALPVLRELTETLPSGAWLQALTVDRQGVELTGQADGASALIPLLEASSRLERAELTSPVTKTQSKEQFRIRAAWEKAR